MISCHEATMLATKSVEKELTFMEKVKLHLHNKLCKPCLFFLQQIKKIHTTLKSKEFKETISFTEEKKKNLEKIIENNL